MYFASGVKFVMYSHPSTFRLLLLMHCVMSPAYVRRHDDLLLTAAVSRSWFHLLMPSFQEVELEIQHFHTGSWKENKQKKKKNKHYINALKKCCLIQFWSKECNHVRVRLTWNKPVQKAMKWFERCWTSGTAVAGEFDPFFADVANFSVQLNPRNILDAF